MSIILASRTTSAYPVSIGTSLALESAFSSGSEPYDKDRTIPQMVNLIKYHELWFNVGTLFRNMYSCLPSSDAEKVSYGDYAQALLEEMEFIKDLVQRDTHGRMKAVFYVANYSHLTKLKDGTLLREQSTPKQSYYKFLHDHAIKAVLGYLQKNDLVDGIKVKIHDKYVEPTRGSPSVIILTHVPYDLVRYSKFMKLDLLESHTGILKNRSGWHTKLMGQAMNANVPFSERMLKTFGDSAMFRPQAIKIKGAIIELGHSRRWTYMTTDAKVKSDVSSIFDNTIRETVLGFEC